MTLVEGHLLKYFHDIPVLFFSWVFRKFLQGLTFFFPNRFHGLLREGEDVFWYYSKSPGYSIHEKFETDVTNGVRGGGTVLVAAIQIAFYLGFREIYLTGVDASYSVPKTVIQSGDDC